MRNRVILHKKDIILNRDRLKDMVNEKDMEYIDLYHKVVEKYGLDITYKGFMSLLKNRSSWKLLYAHAITDVLNVSINDIFDVIDIDIEQKVKDKKKWIEKYEKNKE